jgi:hypothetical protein
MGFRTTSYRTLVTVNDSSTRTYEDEVVLHIRGRDAPFHDVDVTP